MESVENEKEVIKKLLDFKLEEGQNYCLLSTEWWNRWKAYVAFDDLKQSESPASERPSPVCFSGFVLRSFVNRILVDRQFSTTRKRWSHFEERLNSPF